MKRVPIAAAVAIVLAAGLQTAGSHDRSGLVARSNEAYRSGEYLRSARLLVDVVESGWGETNTCFNAACGFALAGRPDSAFALLDLGLDLGYANVRSLSSDSDLASLRDDWRWTVAAAQCSLNAVTYDAFWKNPVWRSEYRENLDDAEKIAGLSRLWSAAKYNFANFDLVPDLDWDRTYFEYLPRVLKTRSTLEYYEAAREMYALLRDGHTYVIPPKELKPALWARPLIFTRLIEGKVIVIRTYGDTGAAAGIVVGDEVVSIDGMAVHEYAEKRVRPYQFASTPQDLDTKTYQTRLLAGAEGTKVTLALARPDGSRYSTQIERVYGKERERQIPKLEPMEMKMLEDSIVYVALNTFNTPETADRFMEAFDEISKARGMIIDIRDNGGGNSGVGWRILSTLVSEQFPRSLWYTREYRPAFRAWGRPESRYQSASTGGRDADRYFSGPVVVLTSPRTYSAAEDFCVGFRGAERGLVVGEATGGSTGQPLMIHLPGGMRAAVCTKRNLLTDGEEFVGVGIKPDALVTPTVSDVRAGRDAALEAAIGAIQAALAE